MNHAVAQIANSIPSMVSNLLGTKISAVAMVCAVGEGKEAAVTAFITPGAECSASFRKAIEMESDYSDTLLSFGDELPPYHGSHLDIDLDAAADVIGVDRVICLVTQIGTDRVSVVRDYDGLEVTLLEATKTQFSRFVEILDGAHRSLH